MSFSFEFAARNKAAARALIASQSAPDCIKAFLSMALDNLREDGPLSVKAAGHLCDGPGSYEVSNAQLHVAALRFSEPPPPTTEAPTVEDVATGFPTTEAPQEGATGENSIGGVQT